MELNGEDQMDEGDDGVPAIPGQALFNSAEVGLIREFCQPSRMKRLPFEQPNQQAHIIVLGRPPLDRK